MIFADFCFAHIPILFAAIKIWCIFYGLVLLSWDIVFTTFPTTFFGIIAIYSFILYFRLEPVNVNIVKRVLGVDLLKSDKALTFQTTSRLLQIKDGMITSTADSNLNGTTNILNALDPNDDVYSMQIIGHRGAGLDAPENTIAAFRNCKLRGCTAVEFDVSLTKDGVAILFHDDNLSRMTGVNKQVDEVTWNEIKNLELIHPLGTKFSNEGIPTFQAAVQMCLDLDLRFFIDIKDSGVVPHILAAYRANPRMYDRAIVTSFNLKIIYDLRRADPNITGCCAWRPGFFRYKIWDGSLKNLEQRSSLFIINWLSGIADWAHLWLISSFGWWFIGISCILLHKDGVRADDLSRWSRKGVRTFLWTVNNPLEKLHIIQNFRAGYLTDTLDMPRAAVSSTDFFTPPQKRSTEDFVDNDQNQ